MQGLPEAADGDSRTLGLVEVEGVRLTCPARVIVEGPRGWPANPSYPSQSDRREDRRTCFPWAFLDDVWTSSLENHRMGSRACVHLPRVLGRHALSLDPSNNSALRANERL